MGRTKVKINNLDNAIRMVKKTIDDTAQSEKMMLDIVAFSIDRVKKTTRSGKSLVTGQKFKEVTEGYAVERTTPEFQDANKPLHPVFIPNIPKPKKEKKPKRKKSKLQRLLGKTKRKLKKAFGIKPPIRPPSPPKLSTGIKPPPPPSRKSNLTVTGQLLDSLTAKIDLKNSEIIIMVSGTRSWGVDKGKTNQSVANKLARMGYEFLGMDERGIKRIKKIVLDEFRRNIKKTF